jgi:hypothetical protein
MSQCQMSCSKVAMHPLRVLRPNFIRLNDESERGRDLMRLAAAVWRIEGVGPQQLRRRTTTHTAHVHASMAALLLGGT